MNPRYSLALFLVFLPYFLLAGPEKKKAVAVRINTPVRIDGELTEEAWKNAPAATDFIEYSPYNGNPSLFKTEVRFLYDDSGLYIGVMVIWNM